MVKGNSRQVIMVNSPDPKLFDQAIFILKDGADGISEAQLLKEATKLISCPQVRRRGRYRWQEFILLVIGASVTGVIWLLTTFF